MTVQCLHEFSGRLGLGHARQALPASQQGSKQRGQAWDSESCRALQVLVVGFQKVLQVWGETELESGTGLG